MKLRELLLPQAKSKIKAGDGLSEGKYKFFTCSPIQNKFYNTATYNRPSLIFGTGGNASIHYCDEPFSTSTDCLVMYGVAGANLELIYQYLHTNLYVLQAGFKGAGLQHISKDYILDIEIDLPNEEMQTNITKQFRQIDDMICYRNQQLLKYDELVKSRFIEMFGKNSNKKKLEDFSILITKGASPKWQGVDYCDEGVLFITSENVRDGYIDYSKQKFLPDTINQIQPRSKLQRNDILINIVNASIGRAALFDSEISANINQAVALVRVKPEIVNLKFLLTYLNSDDARRAYDSMKVGGDKANLSLKNVSELLIPDVDIELQNEFATFVEQTDKLKFEVKEALEKLEILKKSLMQQYFG